MSIPKAVLLVRVALLSVLLAGTVRCAPALALSPNAADAAEKASVPTAIPGAPAASPSEEPSVAPPAPKRVSIDVVRARVNAKRQVVSVDSAKAAIDPRAAAVARELASKGQPLVGTELRLVFASTAEPSKAAQTGDKLVAVQIGSGAKARRAFHVVDEQTGVDGFYDASGRPLERRFLRYPVAHLFIASGFSMKRKHPITKKHRPHLGVDFAAPRGTPVVAVGDGDVVTATWDGPFGRHVRIRHGSEFVSGYAHLDRIAAGIRSGTKVKRGQIIGYVGQTGLATGPHLHFSVARNGKFVDPLTTVLPAAPALSAPALVALRAAVGDVEMALTASADDDGSVRVAHAR